MALVLALAVGCCGGVAGFVLGVVVAKITRRGPGVAVPPPAPAPSEGTHSEWSVVHPAERVYEIRRTRLGSLVTEVVGWRATQRAVARYSLQLPGGVYCRRVF